MIDAAVSHNPATSGGIDKALLTLRSQQRGQDQQLIQQARAGGKPDAGVLGIPATEPADQRADDPFLLP
jgi:hypothetical protein